MKYISEKSLKANKCLNVRMLKEKLKDVDDKMLVTIYFDDVEERTASEASVNEPRFDREEWEELNKLDEVFCIYY